MSKKKKVNKGKKKLFLHIGRHKTGTTSLQDFFSQKSDELAKRGILYPETGRTTRHGIVNTAHHNFSHIMHYKPDADVEALFSKLEKEAEGYDAILLSSEDFQNQEDLGRWERVLSPYEVTVICYLREGLGYGLSGFAQRVHSSSEIFNIRQYMERQNIRLTPFMRFWEHLGDKTVFRLYERDKLKNRDIIDDFIDIIDLSDVDTDIEKTESNPSLSGNLLGLKMLLNLLGQSLIAPYLAFSEAADLDPTFRGKVHISDRVAERLRGLDDYNAVLLSMFPDMTEPSFERGSKLFDLSRWDRDMDLIATIPALAFAKTIRLGPIARVLENHGLTADIADMDFPTTDFIDAIKLPDDSQIRNIRENNKFGIVDADTALKARAAAERKAAEAVLKAKVANDARNEMARKLKARTKKLEKDNQAAVEQLEHAIKDRDTARAELKAQSEKAQAESSKALETFNARIEALSEERDTLSKALKSSIEDRDSARQELKAQSEKAQAESSKALEMFNERIEALSEERDTLSKTLKASIKDRDTARKELKAQSKKAQAESGKALETFNKRVEALSEERDTLSKTLKASIKDRDSARSELKLQKTKFSGQIKTNLKTFQTQLEGIKAERDASAKQIKKLTKDRDDARKAFASKSTQLDLQAGQVFFFRAELFRLKGDIEKAREMYQSALQKDPENKDYAEKLAQLD